MGKTLYARSLGTHIYFCSFFNLDEFSNDATYAVFDDLVGGLEHFGSYKAWLGCQGEFTATDKYRHKRRLSWGKPCIYLSNGDPRLDKGVDIEWLEGNCTFVEITSPIAYVEI